MIYLHPHTAGKPNISDSCFCGYCTRTATLLSRKGACKSFFFGIFYALATKHEQETQHIASQIIPIAISNIPPENRLFQARYFWYSVNCAERIFRSIMEVRTKRVHSFVRTLTTEYISSPRMSFTYTKSVCQLYAVSHFKGGIQ